MRSDERSPRHGVGRPRKERDIPSPGDANREERWVPHARRRRIDRGLERFATRRRWIWDSLSDNEYGMYLIHYMFVSWLQLAILSTPLPAIEKGALVFAGVLLLSWGTSATIRRIPTVSRIV